MNFLLIVSTFSFVTICRSAEVMYNEVVQGSGDSLFEFTPQPSNYSVIAVSSSFPVQLLIRKSKPPSSTEYDQKSSNSMILNSLDASSRYFFSVHTKGAFTLLLENTYYRNISLSQPIHQYIPEASQHLYSFNLTENISNVKISLIYFVGKANLLVSYQEPIPDSALQTENWSFGQTVEVAKGSLDIIKIAVVGGKNTDYTLIIDSGSDIIISNEEISGLVEEDENAYYTFDVDQSQLLKIKLSIFSGDCDLYLKVNERPTLTDFHWKFTDHGSKIAEVLPSDQARHLGSKYFLAVHGKKSSAFVLTVQNRQQPVSTLTSGFPTIGMVEFKEFEYFKLNIKAGEEVVIQLSAGSGNPDVYAKFCNSSKTNCFFTLDDTISPVSTIFYSNHTFGFEEISIKGSGELFIGVLGASELTSEFTIVAAANNEDVLLKSGAPQTATITAGGYRYYVYKLSKWSASSVQFLLTPISGNPDLYVSRSLRPTIEVYDNSSKKSGLDIDSITYTKGKDFESLNGTYYIAVYSEANARFTIVAKENHPLGNTTVQLYPGIPQKDTFYSHCLKHRLYFFPTKFTSTNKQPIKLTITGITGKFMMAVSNRIEDIDFKKQIFWYHWSTNSSSSERANSIIINPSDILYRMKTNYAVLVNTLEFGSDNTATYSILLRIGDDLVMLTDSSPLVDTVSKDKYNYYTFPITLNREDIVIKITAFTGGPMMYVALNNTKPNATDYQFISLRMSSDELLLPWNTLKEKCPVMPDSNHHENYTSCNLYISVSSAKACSYSISVHASRQNTQLIMIPSTTFSILSKSPRQYYGFPNSTEDLIIDCQASIGEAKFYVKILESSQFKIADINFPTIGDFDQQSEVYLIHSQRAKITHQDFKAKCGVKCLLALTVECGYDPCEYSISITQDNIVNLVDGESFLASVSKEGYAYFSYYCGSADQDFIISVSPMDSGDPDLYVKRSTQDLPSRTEFDWRAQTWEGESLVISKDDPIFLDLNSTIRGTFLLGVYGKSACSFTIRVTQDPKPVKKLLSGIPEHAKLMAQDYAYFYYRSSITSDIVVSVTPIYGKAVIYANTQDLYTYQLYENLPSETNYIFSSITDISQYKLLISKDSPYFCVSCNIKIAVLCSVDCEFSIQASHKLKISLLQNGVPSRGEIPKKSWKFYYFEVNTLSDIDFSLSAFSGDPDLFINTNIDISFSSAKWTSLSMDSYEHLVISKDDENFIQGGYYIGVYSNFASTFALTAHIKNSFVKLISGLPSSYSISPSTFMYFQFSYKSVVEQNVFCNLHPSDSRKPEVFVKIQEERIFPGPKVFDFHYTAGNYKDIYSGLYMTFSIAPDYKVFLSVKAGGEGLINFTLSCSGQDDATILKLDNDIFDTLGDDMEKKLYEVNVDQKGVLSIFLIPCQNEQEIRVSSNWTLERKENPDVVVNRLTDGQLTAVLNNAIGRYYIEVSQKSGVRANTSYVITAYFSASGERQILVPGNYGKIDISQEDSGAMLRWEKPVYENLTSFSGEVYYILYLLDNPYHFSACSIMISRDQGKSMVLSETSRSEYLFKGKKKSYINLIAALPTYVKSFRYLPYDAIQVKPPEEKNSSMFWVWILFIVVVFVIIVMLLLMKKTKQINKKIDIEMTVGRNLPLQGTEKIHLTKDIEDSAKL